MSSQKIIVEHLIGLFGREQVRFATEYIDIIKDYGVEENLWTIKECEDRFLTAIDMIQIIDAHINPCVEGCQDSPNRINWLRELNTFQNKMLYNAKRLEIHDGLIDDFDIKKHLQHKLKEAIQMIKNQPFKTAYLVIVTVGVGFALLYPKSTDMIIESVRDHLGQAWTSFKLCIHALCGWILQHPKKLLLLFKSPLFNELSVIN